MSITGIGGEVRWEGRTRRGARTMIHKREARGTRGSLTNAKTAAAATPTIRTAPTVSHAYLARTVSTSVRIPVSV